MSKYFPDWEKDREKLKEILDYRYLIKRFPEINEENINLPDGQEPRKKNRNYCTICNSFFRNKRRYAPQRVLKEYYKLLLQHKNDTNIPEFKDIIQDIFDKTGVVNPKLTSQMLHFLNHDLPIYSAPILSELLNITSPNFAESNISLFCEIYESLNEKINKFRIEKGQDIIKDFKDSFQNNPNILNYISDNKIIDFYFWLPTLDK